MEVRDVRKRLQTLGGRVLGDAQRERASAFCAVLCERARLDLLALCALHVLHLVGDRATLHQRDKSLLQHVKAVVVRALAACPFGLAANVQVTALTAELANDLGQRETERRVVPHALEGEFAHAKLPQDIAAPVVKDKLSGRGTRVDTGTRIYFAWAP